MATQEHNQQQEKSATIRLRYGTTADIDSMLDVGSAAFATNKVDLVVFPERLRTETTVAGLKAWRKRSMMPQLDRGRHPDRHFIVAVQGPHDSTSSPAGTQEGEMPREASGSAAEDIVGWAYWQEPISIGQEEPNDKDMSPEERLGQLKKRAGEWPAGLDVEALTKFNKDCENLKKQSLGEEGDKNMWTLQALAVHPKHQRKGVGSKLVRWGVEKAQESSKDLFLIATTNGRFLYLSLGFEDIQKMDIFEEGYTSMIKLLRRDVFQPVFEE